MKRLPLLPMAWTLAFFVAAVFALDVVAGLLLPEWYVMQNIWESILPDYSFDGIGWGSFLLALVESFVGGFLAAVIFVPIYNFFAGRQPSLAMHPVEEHEEHT